MGSISPTPYSVQTESLHLLKDEILANPLMPTLPPPLHHLTSYIKFTGSPLPSIPINWRFAESISSLKAFEATMLNHLLVTKYSSPPLHVTINTDHASLYFMSPLITQIKDSTTGELRSLSMGAPEAEKYFPNCDLHNANKSGPGAGNAQLARVMASNIYRTKDGRFYHCHGSMNPDPTLTALGLPLNGEESDTYETAMQRVQDKVGRIESKTLDEMMNEEYRQAGTVAWSSEEYFESRHGREAGRVGLYEINREEGSEQKAGWWRESESLPSCVKRPLAGLKVVDLTRVIAAPSITRGLAQMGASVMRVTSPRVTDMSTLHADLSWGKWNCSLHLKDEKDKEKLRELIMEADVVVEGYRPAVMERMGFSRRDIFELVKGRERGIIHVKENCYGWHGEWTGRSGWQQISDACCGVSLEYGRAMGNDEAVTPVFPNSDYCTGVCGSTAVLDALMQRAEKGGSYGVDVALNYYSQWLVRSVGTYSPEVWNELWSRHGSPVFRHYHNMQYTIPRMIKMIQDHDAKTIFKPEYFEEAKSKAIDATLVQVAPVAQWQDGKVELTYNVGTRGNGVDAPRWPEDLRTEIVT